MNRRFFSVKWALLSLVMLCATALVLLGSVKPLRLLLTPLTTLSELHCSEHLCVSDVDQMQRAAIVYHQAHARLSATGTMLSNKPKFVYCTTYECYHWFGGGEERAISYPYLGTIISPASWQVYISQHELVHWFQFTELGAVKTMLLPEWLREGMAYSLSEAPASDIPEYY